MKPTIQFPLRDGSAGTENISTSDNIVIVGANGAGKSRLGHWLEFNQGGVTIVHRISAQRALQMPNYVDQKTHEQAESGLLKGDYSPGAIKESSRWQRKGTLAILSDYDKVLTILFAKAAKRDREHSKAVDEAKAFIERPLFPYRTN